MIRMYDIESDSFREVTQKDWDQLNMAVQAYGQLRENLRNLLEEVDRLARGQVKPPYVVDKFKISHFEEPRQ